MQPDKLSRAAASAIRRARVGDGVAISDITVWELAVLFARGTLRAQGTVTSAVQRVVDASGVIVKPITPDIAAIAADFPDGFPKDPADRIIGATAMSESLTLITRDERIAGYTRLKTIW